MLLAVAVPVLVTLLQCPDGSPPPCGRPAARAAAPAANSVAVLYFDARDTADAYLADGLTEDVATLLGGVSNVQVRPPGVVRSGDTTRARSLLARWPGHTEFPIVMATLALGDTTDPDRWALLLQPEFDPLHGNTRYERLLATLRPVEAVGP